MSRIGRKPIAVPAGVTLTIDGSKVTVKGPKGELSRVLSKEMIIELKDGVLTVDRPSEQKDHKALHGLTRTLISNMVVGVTDGFKKNLEIESIGYRAAKAGDNLNLTLGFSHPVVVEPPNGITIDVPQPNRITVSGIDKEQVGAIAAQIRFYRPPEPYKGKGIRYEGERVVRKVGKAGAKGKK